MAAIVNLLNVYIVSDATGATAHSVVHAVLVHFKGAQFKIKRFPFTRTRKQVEEIFEDLPQEKCIILFTLASTKLRELMIKKGQEMKISAVDIMGPLLSQFSSTMERSTRVKPETLSQQDEDMYRVAEAIHFTLTHDDGLGVNTLDQADLIILGVSRTGKTPTSIYLSCKNLKVGNVPIIKDIPISPLILKMNVKKVGFRISYERLVQLRSERARRMSVPSIPGYSSRSYIIKEMEYCEQLYSRISSLWTIDVTNRSIEETSEWITRNVL